MDNITEHFKESLKDRADNIVNEIATTNPKYKEFSKVIRQLEDALNKLLLEDKFKLFDDYRDAVLQRESFLIEYVYLQGFEDGSELKMFFT